ncbi:MAG: hypothetical protein ICV72_12895 [Aldersonia sp.]|nr:hypothetical protein [Aldersonia sp.]
MRGLVRSLALGAVIVGAASAGAVLAAAPASALGVSPLPGGVQVDLNHDETVWAHQNDIGTRAAGLPHPSAESFGTTLQAVTEAASQYPQGHVSFTVYGPLDNLNGTMVAFKE